ncbi:HWE histidine kinase domain-containing protein [Lichenifustis flavocetrariae]|uniref:Blue-light-activated histidine kinase n=1 Tax=Lichenifustis flavocetrariae TaxID=2949735 RepID=A0AA41Z801_9HYPH|nr:PAS domain-containing protein [Lichenifustis flavocetrariae]MCW6512188.1 PAS domain-containing protein [Lichenifustis flavocetrariae]
MPDQADKSGEQKIAGSDVEGFRETLGPFVVAAETTRMPMVFCNARAPDNPIVFVNQAFLNLTGYDEQEVLGQKFDFLILQGTDPEALTEIRTAFEGGRDLETPVRFRRKDGHAIWVSVFISPVRDEAGAVVQHFASFVDVTWHKREEERLRFLLDELNHRTQNTLATVLAIAGQTLRGMTDERTIEAFEERILALSKTHGLLGSENWDRVGLREVLDQTLATLGIETRISIEGNDVSLRPKEALSLTMAFHELATNAMTYGALSTSVGTVDVSWRLEPMPNGDRVRLHWSESGGPPVIPPSFRGFGRRLIKGGLAQDLNGEVRLAFEATGVTCEIAMPNPKGDRWTSHD